MYLPKLVVARSGNKNNDKAYRISKCELNNKKLISIIFKPNSNNHFESLLGGSVY